MENKKTKSLRDSERLPERDEVVFADIRVYEIAFS